MSLEFPAENYFGALLHNDQPPFPPFPPHAVVVFVDKKLWLVNLTPLTYHAQKYVRETNGFPDSISPDHKGPRLFLRGRPYKKWNVLTESSERHFRGQFDVANSFSSSIFGTLKDVLFSVPCQRMAGTRHEGVS